MNQKRIVVIGGSAAGPKAAAKARRMDQHAEITIIQKEKDFSMASCGYPYYVGGTFDERNKLIATPTGVVRDSQFFMKAKAIKGLNLTEATKINRDAKKVYCKNVETNEEFDIEYDKLVIATGATPVIPPIPGTDLGGITTLQSMSDSDYLRKVVDEKKVKQAVIIGGGLIGMETCEALRLAGIEVTIVEMLPQILGFLDWELARLVEKYTSSQGVKIITGHPVTEFIGKNGTLNSIKLDDGSIISCELAVISIGVKPNIQLAKDAGIKIGDLGGISVNQYMQTNDDDIYAVGDCCEIENRITGKPVLMPMGDLANLEGRVAGQNVIIGNEVKFPGTIQTGICKIFDWTVGSTGLSEKSARQAGFNDITTVLTAMPDKPGFMGANLLINKIVADNSTGQILGVQCIGPGDASKRIATAAMAVQAKMTVEDLVNADLPYAPPYSQAIDTLITTAHVLENKMTGRLNSITAQDVKEKVANGDSPFILDTRGPDEFEAMRLGIGEKLIPLGALRSRMDELPQNKNAEIICYCKISLRGYEAATFLMQNGYTNVKVMEGGVMAWPFAREK
jgi:NADPH-dependent 2,4-dienoyl-CoA reductase/sulfur reductase-like enzyme/rhodanese-related sulfurtransferase